jgi:hypothetical protein
MVRCVVLTQRNKPRMGLWGLIGVVLQRACEMPMLPQHAREHRLPTWLLATDKVGKLRAGRGTHRVCEEPGQERPTHRETRRHRSTHARIRQTEGRPTGAAFQDAQRARQVDVFMQSDGRYVVRGDRGREHIFGAAKATVLLFSSWRSCTGVMLHCTTNSGSLRRLHIEFVPQINTNLSESLMSWTISAQYSASVIAPPP